jgi:hypothetical protein
MPYYEALRCLLELNGVVGYRIATAHGDPYGPQPAWDHIADQMVDYFEQRTGVHVLLPEPTT